MDNDPVESSGAAQKILVFLTPAALLSFTALVVVMQYSAEFSRSGKPLLDAFHNLQPLVNMNMGTEAMICLREFF